MLCSAVAASAVGNSEERFGDLFKDTSADYELVVRNLDRQAAKLSATP